MPQTLDSLPPPAVQWRRESDEERKQRLERAGIVEPHPAPKVRPEEGAAIVVDKTSVVARLKEQVVANKEKTKKSFLIWWSADAAKWRALRSPTNTSTLGYGSFSVGAELTHPEWLIGTTVFSFGPRAVFYNGGQYAKLSDPFFEGNGFANFSSSEIGMAATFTRFGDESSYGLRWLGATGIAYTPMRWISAEASNSASMIARSDTWSRTAISLPGLNVQAEVGADWNSLIQAGVFAGVHGAWPFQIRLRTGLRLSMGMPLHANAEEKR